MIKKIAYLMLPLVFSATSCGDLLKNGHEYFIVRNESDRKIFFDWCTNYKDTVIRPEYITPNVIVGNPSYIINPSSEREIGTEQLFGRIEKLFNDTEYISFMLFDYNLLMTEDPETIAQNYMVLVRYDITLDDLNRTNWTLHFPPTPDMKGIHMYPPYDEVIMKYDCPQK